MNRTKLRGLIVELFSEEGELGHFRQKYSSAFIDAFMNLKATEHADKIVSTLGKLFEDYARAPTNGAAAQAATPLGLTDRSMLDRRATFERRVAADAPVHSDPVCSVKAANNTSLVETHIGQKSLSVESSVLASLDPPVESPSHSESQTITSGEVPKAVFSAVNWSPMAHKFSFRLKGGKLQCGIPFEGLIESVGGAPGAIANVVNVRVPVGSGLESDVAAPARIFGTPTISGDVALELSYCVGPSGADLRTLTSSISVFINHDPKSLWKDLPSNQGDPLAKPDVDTAMLEINGRKMATASKRGRSHAHEGKFRDDDFRAAYLVDSGWTVIAVADGAGSATKSRYGSKIAVSRSVDVLLERLASEDGERLESAIASWHRGEIATEAAVSTGLYPVLGTAAFEACKAIEAEALALGTPVKEFSTTLLVTVYKHAAFGHLFATYWVGDGGVGVYLNDGAPRLLGKVDSGEFAGQTRFLDRKVMTTEEIASRLQFVVVDEFKALIAMTDGITDPYFMTDNNLESGEYWGKLWSEIEPAICSDNPQGGLLAWLDFWSPGNHDDRTIAVLW